MAGKMWNRLKNGTLEALSPTRCASCERPGALICPACWERMVRIDPALSCLRCGAPFGSLVCTECSDARTRADASGVSRASVGVPNEALFASSPSTPPVPRVLGNVDRCCAAAVFQGPPERIIRAYKDGGERRLAAPLAQLLYDAGTHAEGVAPERYAGLLSGADALTFVPVTAAAYRRRGFDHMELVARALSAQAGVPLVDALVKHGHADQRDLGRAGRIDGAVRAYETVIPVEGLKLLVLDDVITTGATVGAVAGVLKEAGALRVDVLSLARVW